MHNSRRSIPAAVLLAGLALAAAGCSAVRNAIPSVPAPAAMNAAPGATAIDAAPGSTMESCPEPALPDRAKCFALLRTDVTLGRGATGVLAVTPAGYGPSDLQSAYALPTTRGTGQRVAIVDAF